jgi:hypothetical protein
LSDVASHEIERRAKTFFVRPIRSYRALFVGRPDLGAAIVALVVTKTGLARRYREIGPSEAKAFSSAF